MQREFTCWADNRYCSRFPGALAYIQPSKKYFSCFTWVQQVQIHTGAVKGRAVKQLLVNWVLYQPRHREEGGQHSTHSSATLPLAPTSCPGHLLTLQLTEPGSWHSFPAGKCLAGSKGNPELLFRAKNNRRVIILVVIEYTDLICEE